MNSSMVLRRFCCYNAASAAVSPKKKPLVFLGSPEVSATVLDSLFNASSSPSSIFEVAAIVTQPPARRGRGKKLTPSPVAQHALDRGFPADLIFTPEKAGEVIIVSLNSYPFGVSVFVAMACACTLVYELLCKGTVNIHPSLLPLYRGAAPVQRALQDGVKETGVSLAYTVRALDSGPIIARETLQVDDQIKITPEESWLSFDQEATILHNKVRAFAGWPGTRARVAVIDPQSGQEETLDLKIITTRVSPRTIEEEEDIGFTHGALVFPCARATGLEVLEIQLPGKKATTAASSLTSFNNGGRRRRRSFSSIKAMNRSSTGRRTLSSNWDTRSSSSSSSSSYSPISAPRMPKFEELDTTKMLLGQRTLFVGSEVDDILADLIINQLMFLDAEDPTKDIKIIINSPGGSVTAAMGIYDAIKFCKADVSTICFGIAASMGALILLAGTKGKRFCMPNARVMIHQLHGFGGGSPLDGQISVREINYHMLKLNKIISKSTGQPLEKVEKDTEYDYYMNAWEAKAYGIVDKVIDDAKPGLVAPLTDATPALSSGVSKYLTHEECDALPMNKVLPLERRNFKPFRSGVPDASEKDELPDDEREMLVRHGIEAGDLQPAIDFR
ncbi:ATP-dependent Clp protease proteolytic subunit 3, chloroplastic [Linum perenne]